MSKRGRTAPYNQGNHSTASPSSSSAPARPAATSTLPTTVTVPVTAPANASSSVQPPSPAATEPSSPGPAPAGNALGLRNTMISPDLDSTQPYSSSQQSLIEINKKLFTECAGKFTGPMKARTFLNTFMPKPPKDSGIMPTVSWHGVTDKKHERDMYQPFVNLLLFLPSALPSRRLLRLSLLIS